MKPKHAKLIFLHLAAILAAPLAHAQLTWDSNGTGSGQTNGAGAWLGPNLWWNGSANQNWVSGSNAIFGGPNTAGGAVTLASPTSVGAMTFNTFTGTYTLDTSGNTLTINSGITMNATSGAVSLSASSIILGAAQTWTNNSSSSLTSSSVVNNGGHLLTIDGTGISLIKAGIISGSGGLTKNGPGLLEIGGQGSSVAHSFTGTITLNNGVMRVASNLPGGNLTLNGGVLEHYWGETFSRTLGAAAGQVQLLGGASGFSQNGNVTTVTLNNNNTNPVVWGSAFFNPSSLVLQASTAQVGGSLTFTNRLDLNGATRTVHVAKSTSMVIGATMSGVISNSSGTAGLTKTGPGLLILSAANTYNGGTTISGGTLRFADKNTMPATGNVTVNDGATLSVGVGTGNLWTTGTSGNATIGGLLSGLGGLSGSTVSYSGNVRLGLDFASGTQTYSGTIADVGTSLGISKSNGGTLVLSGPNSYTGSTTVLGGVLSFASISNVGGGNSALGAPASAANGTLAVGHNSTAGTLNYTGSGHVTNRVVNLAGTTGGATLDASGAGAWTLTSPLTATGVGAKTLILTGSNTDANSLPMTTLAGLADLLTVQKTGAGTWWVGGFSSPKNAWTISAGTLVATGAITTGDQQVTVSGGTLAGTGPIKLQSSKLLTVQAAGSLAPGNMAAGTMAVTGILNISAMATGTGKLNFQIGAPAASDKIAVTGSAQIGTGVLGFSDFTFTDMGGIAPGSYVLISTTAGITGTLDPANRSGLIGSTNGTLQINGNNLEWSTDQDLDGIPDSYELANSTPPSTTGFNPGDDLDADGSSNLNEYLVGTNPNNFDTDADGIRDGYETNTGIWVSATNTGTNPLVLDSDGDTFRDSYEINTGIWVSTTNTGTNPNNPDSDFDSIRDNVETNTGIFVSKTNTGTDPNDSDTDNDGTGDWYEVTASFTSPFLASEKPDVPYPLPDPDASTGATNKPVKVYIMSGQSNMVGYGTVVGPDSSALSYMTKTENKFPNLVDSSGNFIARQDVRYRGLISAIGNGPLAPGFGSSSNRFGPELGFGYVIGWHHDAPVLLLKSSIGNRALGWDILPPGSTTYQADGNQFPAYGETPEKWTIGSPTTPWTAGAWYAGKEFDRFFMHESQWAHPDVAVTNVVDVLDNFSTEYPDWATQGFEIAGFVWWQGDRDRNTLGHANRYEQNLVNLITLLRSYYENRYNNDLNGGGQPNNLSKTLVNAPFVLATLGQTPLNSTHTTEKPILDGMLAVDGESGEYPQFAGNVKTVYAHPLSEGGASNGHYNERAGTYMLVGDALGRAMVELETNATPSTGFASWATTYPTLTNTDASLDFDKGGLETGIEWVLGGNPTSGADDSGLTPTIDRTTDPNGKLLFIFRRTTAAGSDPNTAINVEYGSSLNGWTTAAHQGAAANQITITSQTNGFAAGIDKVTVALPPSLAASGKIFARLKVAVANP
jgi:autotransporter-associated beta strand protein